MDLLCRELVTIAEEMLKSADTLKMTNAYKIMGGKPEEKKPLGRPRRKWKDNIKIDLGEVGFENVDLIHLAQNRVDGRFLRTR
jgi:hypothetical protein